MGQDSRYILFTRLYIMAVGGYFAYMLLVSVVKWWYVTDRAASFLKNLCGIILKKMQIIVTGKLYFLLLLQYSKYV